MTRLKAAPTAVLVAAIAIGGRGQGDSVERSRDDSSAQATPPPTATGSPQGALPIAGWGGGAGQAAPPGFSVQQPFPTPGPNEVSAWRPPPYRPPLALRLHDHYFFHRPIPSGEVNWPLSVYRYGTTFFGEEAVHTGVDLGADKGTPVLAAEAGEVVWAGYGLYRGLEDKDDPYGLAVSIRHDFGYGNQLLFTNYGHMDTLAVWPGQRVEAGETIGTVGDTGHASGPHLHFEVRLGDNRYFATRNPELWMVPPEGWGVLAGRVADTRGEPLTEQLVQITSIESGERSSVWTYAKGTIRPDEFYQENFVISDLPAGPYEVRIAFVGHSFTASLLVHPGQTNFITFRGRQGFLVEPASAPPDFSKPPLP
ncbi:MAG TPA: peptidoglycan DD-metalloendopeptidase family protein [Anaerolineales bacterium]|nr:peptidoglycan DD-metalloendopeptidase family protein [Anaerolineales bacterium]